MKTIKSTTVIALLATVAMFAISCGGGGNKKQTDDASGKKTDVEAAKELTAKAEDKSVTVDNWQSFVKKEYGIDAAVPAGWKVGNVNALNFSAEDEIVMIRFEKSGDNASKVADAAKTLFDKTKTLSSEGNLMIDVDVNSGAMKKGKTYTAFEDLFKPTMMYDGVSDIEILWYYKDNNGIRSVDVSAEKGRMTVKFSKSPAKL